MNLVTSTLYCMNHSFRIPSTIRVRLSSRLWLIFFIVINEPLGAGTLFPLNCLWEFIYISSNSFSLGFLMCMKFTVHVVIWMLQESIAKEFLERLVAWAKNIKVSDPLEEGCRLGPVVSAGQVRILMMLLSQAIDESKTRYTFWHGNILNSLTNKIWSCVQQVLKCIRFCCIDREMHVC